MSMNTQELVSLLLPEGLIEYFDIIKVEKNQGMYVIHLDEKNIPPEQYKGIKLESKGFYEPISVQDFPLRGKACFLQIRRRRWTIDSTGDIVCRDWEVVAKGTRMTLEFATFLKAINR